LFQTKKFTVLKDVFFNLPIAKLMHDTA